MSVSFTMRPTGWLKVAGFAPLGALVFVAACSSSSTPPASPGDDGAAPMDSGSEPDTGSDATSSQPDTGTADTGTGSETGTSTSDSGADSSSSTGTDASSDSSAAADTGGGDGGCSGATPYKLTVKNVDVWCTVTVNGGTPSGAPAQSVCVAAGSIPVSAVANPGFMLGSAPWHDTQGDTGSGELGTSGATHAVVTNGDKCVWVCCPSSSEPCPGATPDQCP